MARTVQRKSNPLRRQLRSASGATSRLARLLLAVAILLGCCAVLFAEDPPTTTAPDAPVQTQPADPEQPPIELRLSAIPRSVADITKVLAELETEIAALAPTTQPATSQPTTQPDGDLDAQLDGWRLELWRALQEFRSQLLEIDRQTRRAESHDEDAMVAQITETLNAYRRKTDEVQALRIPYEITDEHVAEARALYDQENQTLETLAATLTQQEALIAEGFATQRNRITEDIRTLQSRRERLESTAEADLHAADSDDAREIIQLRRRVLAVRATALETSRVNVELRERHTQQEVQQNKLRLDALQPYVASLRHRMNALNEERSRSRVERLRARIESDDSSDLQRVAYRLELLKAEHVAALQRDYINTIKDRFPASALSARESMNNRDKSFWKEFSGSIPRRSPAEVLDAYQEAGHTLARARLELARLQSHLDASLRDDRVLEDKLRKALTDYDEIAAEFRQLSQDRTDEESIRLKNRVAQFRPELRKAYDDTIKNQQDVIERLRLGITTLEENVALWENAVNRLYWAHLIARGPTIFDPEAFARLTEEIKEVRESRLDAALHRTINLARQRLSVVTMVDWYLFGFATISIGYGAYWLTRRCRKIRNEPLEAAPAEGVSEEARPAPRFGLRLRYHLGRVGIGVVPVLVVPALLTIFTYSTDMVGPPAKLGYRLALLISSAAAGFAIVNAALKAPKPRYRLIPCSRAVARYYRRFAYTLVILAVLFLGSAGVLDAMDLAPATTRQLVSAFVLVSTILALIFLLRRETVLNIFPRTQRGRFTGTVTFLRAIHPFLLLLTILLMVMHPIGYRAMAVYICVGFMSTLSLILLAWLIHQIVKEFVYWVVRRGRAIQEKYNPASKPDTDQPASINTVDATGSATEPSTKDDATDPSTTTLNQRLPPTGRAIVILVRWLLIAGVFVTALNIWGLRPQNLKGLLDFELWSHGEQPITLWRIGGAILAIYLAVAISRAVRQTLHTRVYPHHPTIDRGAQAAINTLLHYATIVIGLYIGLQTLQIDFGALLVLFGGLGLGIGLGLQSLVVNFISGLLMLFERHVKIGDVVIVHDKLGEVTKVSMRSTTIRTPDGFYLIIPNGEFINQKVENWTLEGKPIRGAVDVGVSYGADPRRVKDLLEQISFAEPMVRMDPAPSVQFVDFGDSALNFKLVCWFNNPGERWAGMLNMRYTIVEKFRENGIEIPFPQRTLSFTGNPFQIQSVQVPPTNAAMPEPPTESKPVD